MKKFMFALAFAGLLGSAYAQPNIFTDETSNLKGLKSSDGAILTQAIYEDIWDFSDENYAITKLNGLTGIVSSTGKEILSPKYQEISIRKNNVFEVKEKGKWGYVKADGSIMIPIIYDAMLSNGIFSKNGLIQVKTAEKYGCVDKTGKVVIPIIYDDVEYYTPELAKAGIRNEEKRRTEFGLIDVTGKAIVPMKYTQINDYNEDLAKVEIDKKCGYINKEGVEVVPVKYDFIQSFNRDLFANMTANGKQGMINRSGKEVIPPIYEKVGDYHAGQRNYTCTKNKLQGWVNIQGVEVIPCKYDYIDSEAKDGLIKARLPDNKCGFIDPTGKVVIPFIYERVEAFENGKAEVRDFDRKEFFIDTEGKVVAK
jgi:WG containing repeat